MKSSENLRGLTLTRVVFEYFNALDSLIQRFD